MTPVARLLMPAPRISKASPRQEEISDLLFLNHRACLLGCDCVCAATSRPAAGHTAAGGLLFCSSFHAPTHPWAARPLWPGLANQRAVRTAWTEAVVARRRPEVCLSATTTC